MSWKAISGPDVIFEKRGSEEDNRLNMAREMSPMRILGVAKRQEFELLLLALLCRSMRTAFPVCALPNIVKRPLHTFANTNWP
jgi:hypothetical protein